MKPYYVVILVCLALSVGVTYTAYTANVDDVVNKNLKSTSRKQEMQKEKSKFELYKNRNKVVPHADPVNNPSESTGVVDKPEQNPYVNDLQSNEPVKSLEDPGSDITREVSAEKDEAFRREYEKKQIIRAIKKQAEKEGYKVNVEGNH